MTMMMMVIVLGVMDRVEALKLQYPKLRQYRGHWYQNQDDIIVECLFCGRIGVRYGRCAVEKIQTPGDDGGDS